MSEERMTWESTHCPYCGISMRELPKDESGAKHLDGRCIGEAPIDAMSELQKLTVIRALIAHLSQEAKNQVVAELVKGNESGEAKVRVSSNDELVRIDFEKPMSWFAIPKMAAIQLGYSLMQHGGAKVQQVVQPDASS